MTAQDTSAGWNIGQTLNDTLGRVGDLLTLDYLYDRGMVGGNPERQLQNTTSDDDIAGPRAGINPAYLWAGGVALVGLVAFVLVLRK